MINAYGSSAASVVADVDGEKTSIPVAVAMLTPYTALLVAVMAFKIPKI